MESAQLAFILAVEAVFGAAVFYWYFILDMPAF
jgi:hypothetical protein